MKLKSLINCITPSFLLALMDPDEEIVDTAIFKHTDVGYFNFENFFKQTQDFNLSKIESLAKMCNLPKVVLLKDKSIGERRFALGNGREYVKLKLHFVFSLKGTRKNIQDFKKSLRA